MKPPNANPLCKPGQRKALCPYYEGCLDYAVERGWQFWNCSICLHKSKKHTLNDLPMVKDPDPEYPIVSESARQLAVG